LTARHRKIVKYVHLRICGFSARNNSLYYFYHYLLILSNYILVLLIYPCIINISLYY
jgi:hypothetical protein